MDKVKSLINALGVPRLIITALFLSLCVTSLMLGMDFGSLISDSLVRMGMNGVLVLAMVPGILCGIGLNFGSSIGMVCGILGGLISIELDLVGFPALFTAMIISIPFSIIMGYLYALLLNSTKGSEMTVSTYAGFSIISLFCIVWLLAPFKSLEIKWPIGDGLRTTITLQDRYAQVLDKFWVIEIGTFRIPTGLLLFFFGCCILMAIFLRSKKGITMTAAGDNPRFAEACGINVNRSRILGTVLSTILSGIGIIVYAQSYGFYQLYTAPLYMPFAAVAAVLIGGASARKANIVNVIIGVFLFQGLLTMALPIANKIVTEGNLSEVIRIIVQNGIILYALTKVKGAE